MKQRNRLPLSAGCGGLSFTAAILAYILVSLIASSIIYAFDLNGTEASKYIGYLVSPVAIAIALAFVFGYFRQPVKSVLPVKTHIKYYLIGVMLIFGLLFSLNSVNDLLIGLFEKLGYVRKPGIVPNLQGWRIVPAIIVVAVFPAVFEEALFRGAVLNNAQEGAGSVSSVFLVGFLFCLYHGSVEQTVYQFICGCLFTLLAVRSRSVMPTVVIHFINNALILILYYCGLVNGETGMLDVSQTAQTVITVLSACCLAGATVWLILDKTELKKRRKGGVKNFFMCAALGIVVMVVIWITGLFV